MSKRILVFVDWFDPGFKAGGPIRSAVNFVKHMQKDYEVYVFTGDRDLNATAAYQHIKADQWLKYDENVKVYYCSPRRLTMDNIAATISDIGPAVIYLNSMFSRYFTIYPLLIIRRMGWQTKVVLAPRGMLRSSALQFKPLKKKLYLNIFKFLGLHRHIGFQATDATEYEDVSKVFGSSVQRMLVPNWPGYIAPYRGSVPKKPGELRIVFIGRIHPIKNLDILLQGLGAVNGIVLLTVVGSEEDKAYSSRCRAIAASLPTTVQVDFKGEIPNHKLPAIIAEHHILGLPTQGENFGHAIFEALSAGRPALISDQTPWKGLVAFSAGWDLSLQTPSAFTDALQQAVDFCQEEYDKWSKGAWLYVQQKINNEELKINYQKLFN